MIIAQWGATSGVIRAVNFTGQKVYRTGSSEKDRNLSDPSDEFHSSVSAVHYKAAENEQSHISRHTVAQNGDSTHSAQAWREKIHLSNKYFAYHVEFISILNEL